MLTLTYGSFSRSLYPQVTNLALASVYADDYTGTHCVNEEIVRAGFARIASREARRIKRRLGNTPGCVAQAAQAGDRDAQLLARLEAAQAAAKKERKAMWRYGDVGDSEDEGPGGAGGAGRPFQAGAWGGARRG